MVTPQQAAEAFERCSNAGRWGAADQLGTLNLLTPDKRRRAAQLVVEGVCVSLGQDVDFQQSVLNPRAAWHVMHLDMQVPWALHDSLVLPIHGFGTHLDAVGHVYFDEVGYNNQAQRHVVTNDG